MSPLALKTSNPSYRQILYLHQYGRCHYCNRMMDMSPTYGEGERQNGYSFTIEHVLPRSRGGANDLENMVGSCFRCNNERNMIEQRLQGGGDWKRMDLPVDLFIALLPVDIFQWSLTKPLFLNTVVEEMRWGRASL